MTWHGSTRQVRVILLFNLDLDAEGENKLCNGSLGVVGAMPTPEEVHLALEAKLGELDVQVLSPALPYPEPEPEPPNRPAPYHRILYSTPCRARLDAVPSPPAARS
jgi:hypothetical protein